MKNKNLTVINLWGGPGTGKSTTAAGLFNLMKLEKYSVELVTEYAKQLVWEKQHHSIFENQILLLAKQDQKQRVLVDQVKYCITDSPISMGLTYAPDDYYVSFTDLMLEVFNSYNNVNIFLGRVKEYDPVGRNQTYEEALVKDQEILNLLNTHNIPYETVVADENAPRTIFDLLKGRSLIVNKK